MSEATRQDDFEKELQSNYWVSKIDVNVTRDGIVYPYKYDMANILFSMWNQCAAHYEVIEQQNKRLVDKLKKASNYMINNRDGFKQKQSILALIAEIETAK